MRACCQAAQAYSTCIVLDAISTLSPYTRPMFGCLAIYVKDKIVLILRDKPKSTADDGVLRVLLFSLSARKRAIPTRLDFGFPPTASLNTVIFGRMSLLRTNGRDFWLGVQQGRYAILFEAKG